MLRALLKAWPTGATQTGHHTRVVLYHTRSHPTVGVALFGTKRFWPIEFPKGRSQQLG